MEEMKDVEQVIPVEKPRTIFGKADYLATLTVLAAAWSYVWGSDTFGALSWLVFATIYIGANLLYAKMQMRTITKESNCYACFVLAASICLMWSEQKEWIDDIAAGFIFPLLLFYHGFGIYFILTLNRNRIDGCLNEWGVCDMLRGIFVIPFTHFYRLVQAVVDGIRKLYSREKNGKRQYSEKIGQIIVGVGIGCLILLVAVPLLMAAEESFANFMSAIGIHLLGTYFDFFDIFRFENILMIIVACYLYGLSYGAGKTKVPVLTKKEPKFTLAAITCQVVVCGLYLLFFVVKFADAAATVSRGSGTFVYSTYAREGFFELCWIAFLNAMIYYLIRYMAEWDNHKIKVLSTVFCVETIAFVVLAFYKMCLYIQAYGYTFKRVITSWFMMVLLVGFVLYIYQTWRPSNVIRFTVWFGAVSFLLVSGVCCF